MPRCRSSTRTCPPGSCSSGRASTVACACWHVPAGRAANCSWTRRNSRSSPAGRGRSTLIIRRRCTSAASTSHSPRTLRRRRVSPPCSPRPRSWLSMTCSWQGRALGSLSARLAAQSGWLEVSALQLSGDSAQASGSVRCETSACRLQLQSRQYRCGGHAHGLRHASRTPARGGRGSRGSCAGRCAPTPLLQRLADTSICSSRTVSPRRPAEAGGQPFALLSVPALIAGMSSAAGPARAVRTAFCEPERGLRAARRRGVHTGSAFRRRRRDSRARPGGAERRRLRRAGLDPSWRGPPAGRSAPAGPDPEVSRRLAVAARAVRRHPHRSHANGAAFAGHLERPHSGACGVR